MIYLRTREFTGSRLLLEPKYREEGRVYHVVALAVDVRETLEKASCNARVSKSSEATGTMMLSSDLAEMNDLGLSLRGAEKFPFTQARSSRRMISSPLFSVAHHTFRKSNVQTNDDASTGECPEDQES